MVNTKEREMDTHKVTRDGEILHTGTPNDCFAWLLRHQVGSVDYAIKYGGYRIAILEGAIEAEAEPVVGVAAYCVRCDGPVADGGSYCGEC
jgi:hypothetical protein